MLKTSFVPGSSAQTKAGYVLKYKGKNHLTIYSASFEDCVVSYHLWSSDGLFSSGWEEVWLVLWGDGLLAWYTDQRGAEIRGGIRLGDRWGLLTNQSSLFWQLTNHSPDLIAAGQHTGRVPGRPSLPPGVTISQVSRAECVNSASGLSADACGGKEAKEWCFLVCDEIGERSWGLDGRDRHDFATATAISTATTASSSSRIPPTAEAGVSTAARRSSSVPRSASTRRSSACHRDPRRSGSLSQRSARLGAGIRDWAAGRGPHGLGTGRGMGSRWGILQWSHGDKHNQHHQQRGGEQLLRGRGRGPAGDGGGAWLLWRGRGNGLWWRRRLWHRRLWRLLSCQR